MWFVIMTNNGKSGLIEKVTAKKEKPQTESMLNGNRMVSETTEKCEMAMADIRIHEFQVSFDH